MFRRIAVLGLGRFGRSLARLAQEAGVQVSGWDPVVATPYSAESLAEATVGVEAVIPAVPVPVIADVLREVRGIVARGTLIMDVSSVKSGPVHALAEVIGSDLPWIATHPLFGPSSVALGEPLTVVVCPNAMHPGAVARARGFWGGLGCETVLQDAEQHDRLMARTHALAFFVAKAMLDIGVGEAESIVPPSFRAMAQTIQSVREDAAHLFWTIQMENPFSARERGRLLDALQRVHRDLVVGESASGRDTAGDTFRLPDLGERAPDLRETRELIDDLDRSLVALLGRRAQLSRRAGRAKAVLDRPVRDRQREDELLLVRRAWAEAEGLDGGRVAAVFAAILQLSRDLQIGGEERPL